MYKKRSLITHSRSREILQSQTNDYKDQTEILNQEITEERNKKH